MKSNDCILQVDLSPTCPGIKYELLNLPGSYCSSIHNHCTVLLLSPTCFII